MKREQIFLSKNFTVIESDIPFTLKFNIKDNTANSAEDIINFKSGWYIFDNNKLLPQYVDGVYNLPKYNCWIEFDETLGTVPPHWYTCYINPKSVESLSSEVTELDPAQLAALRQDVQTNGGKIDGVELLLNAFKSANNVDLLAVKSSVDALQAANHTDLGVLGNLLTHDNEPGSSNSMNLFDLGVLIDSGMGALRSEPFNFYFSSSWRFFRLTSSSESDFWGSHRIFAPRIYTSFLHLFGTGSTGDYWLEIPACTWFIVDCYRSTGSTDCIVTVNTASGESKSVTSSVVILDAVICDGNIVPLEKL